MQFKALTLRDGISLTWSSKSLMRLRLKAICSLIWHKACASGELTPASVVVKFGEVKQLVVADELKSLMPFLVVPSTVVPMEPAEAVVVSPADRCDELDIFGVRCCMPWRLGGGAGGIITTTSSTGHLELAATVALTYDSYCCSAGVRFGVGLAK